MKRTDPRHLQVALGALCRQFGVRRMALFGSAARGDFGPESDLDILVEFQPVSPRAHADNYFGLLGALEQLFGTAVDLVEWDAIRNPYFSSEVARTQVPVFDAA